MSAENQLSCDKCLPEKHCSDLVFTGGYRFQYENGVITIVDGAVDQCKLNLETPQPLTPEELENTPIITNTFVNERKPIYPVKRGKGEIIP